MVFLNVYIYIYIYIYIIFTKKILILILILETLNSKIRTELSLNQWKNTASVEFASVITTISSKDK